MRIDWVKPNPPGFKNLEGFYLILFQNLQKHIPYPFRLKSLHGYWNQLSSSHYAGIDAVSPFSGSGDFHPELGKNCWFGIQAAKDQQLGLLGNDHAHFPNFSVLNFHDGIQLFNLS